MSQVWVDEGTGDSSPFSVRNVTDITATQYTETGLNTGYSYRFYVTFLSEAGESEASPMLSVVAANTPTAPAVAKNVFLQFELS